MTSFVARFHARRLALVGGSALLLGACGIFFVDHDENSIEFCQRNAEILEVNPIDEDRIYTEDQANYFSDEVSKTMRYAEDATREVRSTARDMSDAYDDVREIAGDDDVPEDEIDEKYTELRKQRAEMRELCGEILAALPAEEGSDG